MKFEKSFDFLAVWSKKLEKPPLSGWFTPLALFGITLAGFGLRLFYLYMDPMVSNDAVFYIEQANLWNQGGWGQLAHDAAWVPPLLPWSMSRGIMLGFSAWQTGITLSIIAGTLLIPVSFVLSREFFSNGAWPLAAALFTAIIPRFLELSIQIQRESLYLLFFTLALWGAVKALKSNKNIYWALSGGTVFCTALVRYEALEMIPFILIFLIFRGIVCQRSYWKSCRNILGYLSGIAVFCGVFSWIIGIPLTYYTEALFDRISCMWN